MSHINIGALMHYYLVWVSSPQFQSSKPLTYGYDGVLSIGSIVRVPIRNKSVIALVDSEIDKPDFTTKDIEGLVLDNTLPVPTLALFKWLMSYYPATSSSQLQLFLPNNLLKLKKDDVENAKIKPITLKELNLPSLTEEQAKVIKAIRSTVSRTILLHGDTSSGKTRVYIEQIFETLKQNKSAIVLTPEIGLTPQLVNTLEESFKDRTIVMHSSLSENVRRENWLKILNAKQPIIVVGPRSALFSPINNLGLIVMDEAHEASYKQENSPYYQSSRVAGKLAEINDAKLIMGTASPLVSDYYALKTKDLLIARMINPAVTKNDKNTISTKTVKITERDNFAKSAWLSNQLINSITQSLSDNEQSIVFLNRRGTAQVILCQNCGWQALCPNCDTSLTYHADTHTMVCHSCSYSKTIPSSCPVCHSPDIIFRGAGTKAVEEELKRLFPAARISRFDKDNKKVDSLEQNYDKLLKGEIDIAIGTQIITKGLDLPGLSTVGIVIADSGLFFPDYMAEERTFQNLMQVIGRVGRGHTPGRVILQSYHPESISIQSAIHKDFKTLYDQQIVERKKYEFPPFVFLLVISAKRSSQKNALAACEKLIERINNLNLRVKINGPAPAFYEKQNGRYVWQLIIKSTDRSNLIEIIKILPGNYSYDIDPSSLL